MSERKPCQCGSIDFTGEDESQAYETPRAFHWFDRPCEAKPQPPTTKAELRAALFSATERAERAERERDEARADHLRVRDECFATMEALADERKACDAASELSEARYVEACNQAQRAVEMEAERDAARSEVERLRAQNAELAVHRDEYRRLMFEADERAEHRLKQIEAAESERDSLAERLDAALARLHETSEALREVTPSACGGYGDFPPDGGWDAWEDRHAAVLASLAPSPSTTPPLPSEPVPGEHYWLSHEQMLARWPSSIVRDADTYHTSCLWCGVMKRGDGKPQKPCRGRVEISLRSDPSTTPETPGEATRGNDDEGSRT